ncbi:DUF4115 domain-containing protein [Dethiobacter alkaliphilus]|uniref:DUF4115 domain-containing protein n=1 Tax=Dethiobacter alkaliphilus TaxID=427926 RepID=UPI002227E66B|nr:RodZ domain-containing protein [Dethiobacter alkaliphilus]MCW3488668.1 DUF4115 domain-containing protein [Dethiobacter alkaliphilus]
MSEKLPGLKLDRYQFGLNSRTEGELPFTLQVDTEQLESDRAYHTSLVITTNGEPEKIVVPLSIMVADRKKRVREAAGLVLLSWLLLSVIYGAGLLDRVGSLSGIGSPFKVTADPAAIILNVAIFWTLLVILCLPPAMLFSGRSPRWYGWLLFMAALALVGFGLTRAVSNGETRVAWAFGVIIMLALIPLLASVVLTRYIYYRSPHLSGILAFAVTAGLVALSWGGLNLYANYSGPAVTVMDTAAETTHQSEGTEPEIVLNAESRSEATCLVTGGGEKEVLIVFTADCWIRVTQDGKRITEKTYVAGEEVLLGDAAKTRIRFGNPGGAEIIINGISLNNKYPQSPIPRNLTIVRQE